MPLGRDVRNYDPANPPIPKIVGRNIKKKTKPGAIDDNVKERLETAVKKKKSALEEASKRY